MYIYIYISAAPPKGEQSVLKPRCRILRAPWAPTLPPALPNRVEVFAPNFDEKLNPLQISQRSQNGLPMDPPMETTIVKIRKNVVLETSPPRGRVEHG